MQGFISLDPSQRSFSIFFYIKLATLIIIFENYYKQIFKKTNTITKKTMLGPTGYNNFIFLI